LVQVYALPFYFDSQSAKFDVFLNFCLCIYNFRGGKICLTDHFKPLWARNVPKFGIAHAMALGVSKQL
jgi:hypothetical protein